MSALSADEWLLGEETIAHIRACIWYRKDGTLRLQLPLSMVARTHLQHALEDGSLRSRGPLQVPHDMPPQVGPHWPVVEIPSAFWRSAEWDGGSGFRNRSRSERLPWFEVAKNKNEIYQLWPELDRRSMPAPFNDDWPLLQDVIEAMTRRLGVGKKGALQRLVSERPGVIKARRGGGSDGGHVVAKGQPVDLSALSGSIDIRGEEEFPANCRGEPIVVCGEDVIALWPSLVLSETGEIAPPLADWRGLDAVETSAVSDAVSQADAGTPKTGPESSEVSSVNVPLASSANQLHPTRSRTVSLAKRVAAEFVQMFPGGRPAMKVKELMAQVRLRPGFGTVSARTVEEALHLAWPPSHPTA